MPRSIIVIASVAFEPEILPEPATVLISDVFFIVILAEILSTFNPRFIETIVSGRYGNSSPFDTSPQNPSNDS